MLLKFYSICFILYLQFGVSIQNPIRGNVQFSKIGELKIKDFLENIIPMLNSGKFGNDNIQSSPCDGEVSPDEVPEVHPEEIPQSSINENGEGQMDDNTILPTDSEVDREEILQRLINENGERQMGGFTSAKIYKSTMEEEITSFSPSSGVITNLETDDGERELYNGENSEENGTRNYRNTVRGLPNEGTGRGTGSLGLWLPSGLQFVPQVQLFNQVTEDPRSRGENKPRGFLY